MVHDQRSALSTYMSGLLSAGRVVFAGREAQQTIGIGRGAFLDAAERLQRRKYLLNPRQDFYVVVPPQFAAWGAPPPSWYIDDLMRHEGEPYYVGLLKAAELHGAAHQAVMEFQVVAGKRLPKIRAGRNLIVFYYRKDMGAAAPGIEDKKTDTGSMKVSSAALTALDLLRYPQAAGGIDNVATVLADLGREIDAGQLAELAAKAECPVVQRLGYLLDQLGHGARAAPMHAVLEARGSVRWTELDRKQARDPDFAPAPQERNARWRVIVRRAPEVDE
ncbi:MAG: type IV toxin-antitoxin system AbiEi family antitoxin domain-containing protein [Methyloceanibacter sp.]